jgi:hypothetical protein
MENYRRLQCVPVSFDILTAVQTIDDSFGRVKGKVVPVLNNVQCHEDVSVP